MTWISIVLDPTFNDSDPLALAEVTDEYDPPFTRTWMLALAWLTVGVTVVAVTLFATDAV